ncbi:MAG: hypothetical protein B7Z55_05090 [Planctomycetales bacterium 12-60-4]|nr:MAG: hypothetical protein B7Z55_05090 [Planctomycetales bacterium 12-60-4]
MLERALVSPGISTADWGTRAPARDMDACEVRRRLLHMLPGFFPFLLWLIPHPDPWGPYLVGAVLTVMMIVCSSSLSRFASFARPGEANGFGSILGYAFPVLATVLLFRGREELALMTLVILAFGDGSATLGGMKLGGRRLPWNRRKTFTGILCFVGIGGPLASLAFWGECRPGISLELAFACGLGTTLTAAVAESMPSKWNDNLRVGLTAVFMGALLELLLVG